MLPTDILPICAMKRRMAPGLYLSAPSLLTSAPMMAGAQAGRRWSAELVEQAALQDALAKEFGLTLF